MAGEDAFGVKLRREDEPGSGEFEEIANIDSFGGPDIEREPIETTTHDSPDQWEEYVFGIKRSGQIDIDINYDPTQHDKLLDDFDSPYPRRYQIVWPEHLEAAWSVKAGLIGFEPDAPHDDKLEASLSFKLSGKPNFDAWDEINGDNGNGGGGGD